MHISAMNWMQVETYLKRDGRAVLPLGSTEQHAYLSLSVDSILSERVAMEAAEPLGIPVFPVLAYGITPYFLAYPGTISVRVATYLNLIEDILDSLAKTGFRRIVIVNGHGGNTPAEGLIVEWLNMHPEMKVKFHNWWRGPQVWAKVMEIDPVASHASWMENFPWTRLPGVDMPAMQKQLLKREGLPQFNAITARAFYGDGNFNGYYQRSDEEMQAIWQVAVAETRGLLTAVWD